MKKVRIYDLTFLLLQLLLPVCIGLGLLLEQPFQLATEPVFFILLAVVSVFLTVKLHGEEHTRLAVPALLFSLVNGIAILLTTQWWGAGIAAVTVIVCGWVVFFQAPSGIVKTLCHILNVLLTLPVLVLVPLWMFAVSMGQVTVVQELTSPEGRYTAQLIDVDAGATGGDTLVKVRDNEKTVNILIGSFVKESTVYSGDWGEFFDMELRWQDEDTLLINGWAYEVDVLALLASRNAYDALGITISGARVVEHSDSHGGFLGDGITILKASGQVTIPDSRFWHDLPIPEFVQQGINHFALGQELPKIKNGHWFFLDRHSKSTDPGDHTKAFSHGSYNFTFAVYDSDAQMLYYFKVDT